MLDRMLARLQERGHRVVLFSQFNIMLNIIGGPGRGAQRPVGRGREWGWHTCKQSSPVCWQLLLVGFCSRAS